MPNQAKARRQSLYISKLILLLHQLYEERKRQEDLHLLLWDKISRSYPKRAVVRQVSV